MEEVIRLWINKANDYSEYSNLYRDWSHQIILSSYQIVFQSNATRITTFLYILAYDLRSFF